MKTIPLASHRRILVLPAPLIAQTADFPAARPGQPLDEKTMLNMETLFDADFSDVRVHVGPEAEHIGALAFAWGSHLYFAPETYQPETRAGRHLLAHELTHVLQQRAGRAGAVGGVGTRVVIDPALEAEAEQMGRRAAARGFIPAPRRTAKVMTSSTPAPVLASGGIIQPALRISKGAGKGYYDMQNLKILLDGVAKVLNSDKDAKVRRGPLELVRGKLGTVGAREIFVFATMDELAQWMQYAYLPTPTPNVFNPKLVYGAAHGDYHFIADPIKKKTAWDLSKEEAKTLMETEITKHVDRLFTESSLDPVNEWSGWYISGMQKKSLGRYFVPGVRGGKPTNVFCMQVQVNVRENRISYHGYPDEDVKPNGIGRSKSEI